MLSILVTILDSIAYPRFALQDNGLAGNVALTLDRLHIPVTLFDYRLQDPILPRLALQ